MVSKAYLEVWEKSLALSCKAFSPRPPNFLDIAGTRARVPASERLTRPPSPRIGMPPPRTDEVGFFTRDCQFALRTEVRGIESETRTDDRGLHSQPADLGRTELHDEGYSEQ
jgi:hypothetical protein